MHTPMDRTAPAQTDARDSQMLCRTRARAFSAGKFSRIGTSIRVGLLSLMIFLLHAEAAAQWSPQTSGVGNDLRGVHFINSNEGWTAGASATLLHTTDGGANWAPVVTGVSSGNGFAAVRALSASVIWVGGNPTSSTGITSLARSTDGGANWTIRQGGDFVFDVYNSIFPVSASTAWSAGSETAPPFFIPSRKHCSNNFDPTVNRSCFVEGGGSAMLDIHFIDIDNGWSVGFGGQIRRITNASASPSFAVQTSGTTQQLNGIYMVDANNGWAVGNNGTILHTANGGMNWTPQTNGVPATSFFDVFFDADLLHGWAVGAGGVILATINGGNGWFTESSGVSATLRGVFFTSGVGYAVGDGGVILKRTGPTECALESFTATGYDDGRVLLQWRTGFEIGNLGFNTYREHEGRRVRLNQHLLAGSALTVGAGTRLGAGKSYAWWDGASGSARYWLEEIDLSGKSAWHGPFLAKPVGGAPPARSRAALLSSVGNAQTGIARPVEPAAALHASAKAASLQDELAAQRAVKLSIKREGFYRVAAEELFAAGLDRGVDPRFLQMFADGQPLPISVAGEKDGRLDLSDTVEFYGIGLDAASTDTRVYWLAVGSQFGQRIPLAQEPGLPTPRASFAYTVERRDRSVYFSALRNGEQENFFGAVIAGTPVDQTISLEQIDTASRDNVVIEATLQGATSLPHKVSAQLNGASLGDVDFDGQAQGIIKAKVPHSLLKEGANIVTLTPLAGDGDVSLVDRIRLTYQRRFTADGDALRFALSGKQQASIEGFSSSDVRVIDVTDPNGAQELAVSTQRRKGGYAVTFTAPGAGERRLMAFASNRISSPAAIAPNQPSSLRQMNNAADLLIVARRDFFSSLEPLVALRQREGLSVSVVDIEDIFDEFSYGEKSPQAIKDFFAYAMTSWKKKPAFVIFAADASYDPKNYLGFGDWDIVPTKLIDTQLMESASDDWFADFNDDGLAEMFVGRLPARTAEEAAAMAAKIVSYENSPPLEEALLVADTNNGYDFERTNAELRLLIPRDIRAQEINRGRLDSVTAKSMLIDGINRGQKIVNYTGHGSVDLWSGNLLTSQDAAELSNGDRLPLFVMMTCLNGYFHDAALDSLAEALMKTERGGAIAVWTSSGMTAPDGQAMINRQMYRLIFDTNSRPMRLGEVTQRSKQATSDRDIRRSWILFGDPTMKLK
jgi:photosystem II stability/assembly factor-like uncharacterized protein